MGTSSCRNKPSLLVLYLYQEDRLQPILQRSLLPRSKISRKQWERYLEMESIPRKPKAQLLPRRILYRALGRRVLHAPQAYPSAPTKLLQAEEAARAIFFNAQHQSHRQRREGYCRRIGRETELATQNQMAQRLEYGACLLLPCLLFQPRRIRGTEKVRPGGGWLSRKPSVDSLGKKVFHVRVSLSAPHPSSHPRRYPPAAAPLVARRRSCVRGFPAWLFPEHPRALRIPVRRDPRIDSNLICGCAPCSG